MQERKKEERVNMLIVQPECLPVTENFLPEKYGLLGLFDDRRRHDRRTSTSHCPLLTDQQ